MIGLERRTSILNSGAKSPLVASLASPIATPRSHSGDASRDQQAADGPGGNSSSSSYLDDDDVDHEDHRPKKGDGVNGNSATESKRSAETHPTSSQPSNHDADDDRGTVKSPPFIRSRFTYWVVLARVLLVLDFVPPDLLAYLQSPSLASVVADPTFTWRHVREAWAIRNLYRRPSSFAHAYRLSDTVHLPPLLLAAMDVIANRLEPYPMYMQKLIVGLILLAVDLAIALLFERLGATLLIARRSQRGPAADGDTASWEESRERDMPDAIRPPLKHVFFWTTTTGDAPSDSRVLAIEAPTHPQPPLFPLEEIPRTIAFVYFACPITIVAAHVYEGFRNLPLLLLLSAIVTATTAIDQAKSQGTNLRSGPSFAVPAFLMALAAYVDVHMVVFVIPLSLSVSIGNASRSNRRAMMVTFFSYFACLHVLSFLLIGGDEYLKVVATSHLQSFQISHHPPSLSVLWYFGMEVFLRFQRFFAILLGGLPYILIGPLTIRLWRYPEVLTAIFWMLGVLFRPPSTLYEFVVGMCLAGLCPKSCIRMRTAVTLVSLCAVPIPATLFVVTHWLWLVPGSGEANFLYFQALAYNAFVGLLTVEFTGASLRRDKALRLTEKELQSKQPESSGVECDPTISEPETQPNPQSATSSS